MDAFADVMTGGFTFDVVTERQHDFGDGFVPQALFQGREVEVFRPHAIDGRESSMQDVVSAPVSQGTLQRHQVGHLLHDAKGRRIALGVAADLAERRFGQTAATVATADALGGRLQGSQQWCELGRFLDQEVQGDPFRGPMPEAGELAKELADFLEGRRHGLDQSPGKEKPAVALDISAS